TQRCFHELRPASHAIGLRDSNSRRARRRRAAPRDNDPTPKSVSLRPKTIDSSSDSRGKMRPASVRQIHANRWVTRNEPQNHPIPVRYRVSKARKQFPAGLNKKDHERQRERPVEEVRLAPSSGRAGILRKIASRAPTWAARCVRQNVEVKIVTDSEKKSVFNRTSDNRQTSPAVTPPTLTHTVNEGSSASRQ